MKKITIISLFLFFISIHSFATACSTCGCCGSFSSSDKNVIFQTLCPVMGGKINKDLFVDYNNKRIYVCCAGCIAKVKADPKKFIQELEKKGIKLGQVKKDESKKE